jgi:solute carrier family 25 oxoglutarate transporter 11
MSKTAEALQPFVCGGLSACLGSTVVHPADLVKVRQQVSTTKQGPLPIVKQILSTNGVRGLYVGLGTALTRQMTYGTARIGLHRVISDRLELISGGNIPFWEKAASGMVSGAMAVMIGSPFDIALVRIQNDGTLPAAQRRNYTGVFNALARVSREEGIRTLWRGLTPNIARGMAMNVGMMSSYDQAKQLVIDYITHDPNPKKPTIKTSIISSAIAGVTCAVGSLPFDVMKSRIMFQKADPVTGQMPYRGVIDCAIKTYRKEGFTAFFRGLPAYYFRCAPHAMVILLSVEQITKAYRFVFGLDQGDHDMVTALRFHSSASSLRPHSDNDEQDFDEEDFREHDEPKPAQAKPSK